MSSRADKLARARHKGLTGNQIEEAFASRLVVAPDGRPVKKGDKVEALDFSKLDAHLEKLREGNSDLEIAVVHRGSDFVVIDKPAGIASHPLRLADTSTVTHWAFSRYPETKDAFPEPQPTLAPHRLDTGTSGVLIVCLEAKAYLRWRDHFEKKRIKKIYLAWCWGNPSRDTFEINYSLAHDSEDPRKMAVPSLGQAYLDPILEAQSLVRVRERRRDPEVALMEVTCHTGVTHQVRAHLASVGYPLVGDALYDSRSSSRDPHRPTHRLRAWRLETPEGHFEVSAEGFEP